MNVASKGQSSRGEPAAKLSAAASATVNTRNFPAHMALDWTGIAGNTADPPNTITDLNDKATAGFNHVNTRPGTTPRPNI